MIKENYANKRQSDFVTTDFNIWPGMRGSGKSHGGCIWAAKMALSGKITAIIISKNRFEQGIFDILESISPGVSRELSVLKSIPDGLNFDCIFFDESDFIDVSRARKYKIALHANVFYGGVNQDGLEPDPE